MNKNYISFTLGFLFGGVVGAIASKTYFEKKANDRADKEIDGMREHYEGYNVPDETRNALHKNWDKPSMDELRERRLAETEHPMDSDEDENTEEVKADLKSEEAKDYYEKNKTKPPKIISMKDIGDYPEFFEETEWLFYKFDGVLTNEDDEVIEDEMRFIGNALDKYDFRNNDDEQMIVVSFEYCTIYTITKLYLSYADKMARNNKYFSDLKEYGYAEVDVEDENDGINESWKEEN